MDIITDSTSSESEIETKIKFRVKRTCKKLCIICMKPGPVIQGSEKSFATFMECLKLREKITNQRDDDLYSKVTSFQEKNNFDGLVWHRSCYSSFTSKQNLVNLRKRSEKEKQAENTSVGSAACLSGTSVSFW